MVCVSVRGRTEAPVLDKRLARQRGVRAVERLVDRAAVLHAALVLDLCQPLTHPVGGLLLVAAVLHRERQLKEAQGDLVVRGARERVRLVEPVHRVLGPRRARLQLLEEDDLLVCVPAVHVVRPKLAARGVARRRLAHDRAPLVRELVGVARERRVVLHRDRELEALAVEPGVPIDLFEARHDLGVLGVVREQVLLPLLGAHGAVVERAEVRADVRHKHIEAADDALEVQQKVGALVVGDRAVRVVGVLALGVRRDEALEARRLGKLLERAAQLPRADDVRKAAVRRALLVAVHLLQEEALEVHRPALVEPERLPVHARGQVAAPRVAQLVEQHVGRAAVATHEARRERREVCVLHAAVRERRREHHRVVARPRVGRHELLGLRKEALRIRLKLPLHGVRVRRLRPDARARAERAELERPADDREQVRGDRHGLRELVHLLPVARLHRLAVAERRHQHGDRRRDRRRVRDLAPGRVEARHQRARVDRLALRVQKGMLLRVRLLLREPPKRRARVGRGVRDLHRDLGVLRTRTDAHDQGLAQRVAALAKLDALRRLPVDEHVTDVEVRRVKDRLRRALLQDTQRVCHAAVDSLLVPVDRPVEVQAQRKQLVDVRQRVYIADLALRRRRHSIRRRRRPNLLAHHVSSTRSRKTRTRADTAQRREGACQRS